MLAARRNKSADKDCVYLSDAATQDIQGVAGDLDNPVHDTRNAIPVL